MKRMNPVARIPQNGFASPAVHGSHVVGRILGSLCLSIVATTASAQTPLIAPTEPGADLGFTLASNAIHMITGAPGSDERAGRVYSFECIGQKCLAPVLVQPADVVAGDQFGASVSMFASTLVVGAPDQGAGAVYVYSYDAGGWMLAQKLTAPSALVGDRFGAAVSVFVDRIAIGAPGTNDGAGKVFVFENSGGWSQVAMLEATDAHADHALGSSVVLGADTVVAGAPHWASATVGAFSQGAAYVFVRSASVWTEQARLQSPSSANGQLFGYALDLSGERALIGAPLANAGGGSAHAFQRSGSNWSLQAQLSAPGNLPGDRFGWSVALDNDQALIGAPFALAGCGSSTRFSHAANVWTASPQAISNTRIPGGLAGWSVHIRGERQMVGVPGYSGASSHVGAAWLRDDFDGIFNDGFESNGLDVCIAD